MGVGLSLIVSGILAFSGALMLAVMAYEVWDLGWDYITDKVLGVAIGMAALSLFLLGVGLIIGGIGMIVS